MSEPPAVLLPTSPTLAHVYAPVQILKNSVSQGNLRVTFGELPRPTRSTHARGSKSVSALPTLPGFGAAPTHTRSHVEDKQSKINIAGITLRGRTFGMAALPLLTPTNEKTCGLIPSHADIWSQSGTEGENSPPSVEVVEPKSVKVDSQPHSQESSSCAGSEARTSYWSYPQSIVEQLTRPLFRHIVDDLDGVSPTFGTFRSLPLHTIAHSVTSFESTSTKQLCPIRLLITI
jgi:hypothetical protein